MTPAPQHGFRGLSQEILCVCARTWLAAVNAGHACPLDLEATHAAALEVIPLALMETHAV